MCCNVRVISALHGGALARPRGVILRTDLVQRFVDDGPFELHVLTHDLVGALDCDEHGVASDESPCRFSAPFEY